MSRIHEALKKAEQERAAGQVTEQIASIETSSRDSLPRDGEPAITRGLTIAAGQSGPARSTDYLRFEDLRKCCAHPHWQLDPNVNLFSNSHSGRHGAEQFRTLRSRLRQLCANHPLKTLLVTSAIPGEGKTFVTNNLAQAIVRQPDRRVLIIDADLRCPHLHIPLGAPLSPGLTDYLRGEADEMEIIQNGDQGNLCVIAGGNEAPDPSELLWNGRLKMLLDRLVPVFDWVILDSPPCLPVADASILADLCDGVLMVVRAGSTPSEVAQKACQKMPSGKLIGVVLNAADKEEAYGSYYHQSYGYSLRDTSRETDRVPGKATTNV